MSFLHELGLEPWSFRGAKYYNRSVRNQKKPGDKYYILSVDEPQVYGIFRTLKMCKKELMERRWKMNYMAEHRGAYADEGSSTGGEDDYFSAVVIGLVVRGSVKVGENGIRDDAPPQIWMQEDDYIKCLKKKHPNLEHVGVFRATKNTCIEL